MSEPREVGYRHILRSASATSKVNAKNRSPTVTKSPSTPTDSRGVSAARMRSFSGSSVARANPRIPQKDDSSREEVRALRLLLREREEQVELLHALLSEKQLLLNHNKAAEERLRQCDEQLGTLAAVLGLEMESQEKDNLPHTTRQAKGSELGTVKKMPSVRCILDRVQQLVYDKTHLESELDVKLQELEWAQTELEMLRGGTLSQKVSLKNDAGKCGSLAQELESQLRVNAELERTLADLKEKYIMSERILETLEKDHHQVSQVLHGKEKEVLELQRKERSVAAESSKRREYEIYHMQWKEPNNLITTHHRCHFRGDSWVGLLREKPQAMQAALLKDISLELRAPYGFITIATMESVSELVVFDVIIRHPVSLSEDDVELRLIGCSFDEMSLLLKQAENPKEGHDLVLHQLKLLQGTIVRKEEEIAALTKQLRTTKLSLEERQRQYDEENKLVHMALDETEETVKVTYSELKMRELREEELKLQLQQCSETILSRDQRIMELTAQLRELNSTVAEESGENARTRDATCSNGPGDKHDGRSAEGRKKCVENESDGLCDTLVKIPSVKMHVVDASWKGLDPLASTEAVMTLDSRAQSIVRTILIGEMATVAHVLPLKVLSLQCTCCSLRAEVQVHISSQVEDADRSTEGLDKFRPRTTIAFLEEWFNMRELIESRGRRVQSLADELTSLNLSVAAFKESGKKNEEVEKAATTGTPSCAGETSQSDEEKTEEKRLCESLDQQLRLERTQVRTLQAEKRAKELALQRANDKLNEVTAAFEALQSNFAGRDHRPTRDEDANACRLADVQAKRRHGKNQKDNNMKGVCDAELAGGNESLRAERGDVWSALADAYEEYDTLYERYENAMKQLQDLESSLREKLLLTKRSHVYEKQVEELTQQKEALIAEQEKQREKEALLRETVTSHQRDIDRLQKELDRKTEWAEEVMRRLVEEEDECSRLEGAVRSLKQHSTAEVATKEKVVSNDLKTKDIQRVLYTFCTTTLGIDVPEQEQSVDGVLALIARAYANKASGASMQVAFADREEVSTAIQSLNTAVQLLQQSLPTVRRRACSDVRSRGRAAVDNSPRSSPTGVRKVPSRGRPMTFSGRGATTSPPVRAPQISGRRLLGQATPMRSAPTNTPKRHKTPQQEKVNTVGPCHPLISSATRVVQLVQQLTGTPVQPKVKPAKTATKPLSNTAGEELAEEFVRWSREQTISLALIVKDYLHDALRAMSQVALAHDAVTTTYQGLPVDHTLNLNTAKSCVTHALKSIVQTISSLLSHREISEIEGKFGKDYLSMTPAPRGKTTKQEDPRRQCSAPALGLTPRPANITLSSGDHCRSVSRDVDGLSVRPQREAL